MLVPAPTLPCPRCSRQCAEVFDPFGYSFTPALYACDNCERGDVGGCAGGPLTFTAGDVGDVGNVASADDTGFVCSCCADTYAPRVLGLDDADSPAFDPDARNDPFLPLCTMCASGACPDCNGPASGAPYAGSGYCATVAPTDDNPDASLYLVDDGIASMALEWCDAVAPSNSLNTEGLIPWHS
jgi:hypothetical protein